MPRLLGTADYDYLEAPDGRDWTIRGFGLDDYLIGAGGNDRLFGGDGGDFLSGGAGDDLLRGGADADSLGGDDGNDRLNGDAGDDSMNGGAGDDVLLGGTGGDFLGGDEGRDVLYGGRGDDWLDDHSLAWNELFGGEGSDVLSFDNGIAFGGKGADFFLAQLLGPRYAIEVGGEGADRFYLRTTNDGQLGLGHVADFDPAAGDRLSLAHRDAATGFDLGSGELFAALDSNLSGTLGDGDAAAVADGNRLWLHIFDDVLALDFANGAAPRLTLADFLI